MTIIKLTDIPNFSKSRFLREHQRNGAEILKVIETIQENFDLVSYIQGQWASNCHEVFCEMWANTAWKTAKKVLWGENGIKDESLAYMLISQALPMYMKEHDGYNEVSGGALSRKDSYSEKGMTQMDATVIATLQYCIEEMLVDTAISDYFNTKTLEHSHCIRYKTSLDSLPREQLKALLRTYTESDCIVEDFMDKADELFKAVAPSKEITIRIKVSDEFDEDSLRKISTKLMFTKGVISHATFEDDKKLF